MGIYTKYTLKQKIPVTCIYRCSKCGRINMSKQFIDNASCYDNRGTFTRGRLDDRYFDALSRLRVSETSIIEKAKDVSDIKKYYAFNLKGVCDTCKNVEPWSQIDKGILRFLVFGSFFAAVIITAIYLLLLIDKEIAPSEMLPPVALSFSLFACLCFVRFMWRKIHENRISRLPEENLPRIAMDETECQIYMNQLLQDEET